MHRYQIINGVEKIDDAALDDISELLSQQSPGNTSVSVDIEGLRESFSNKNFYMVVAFDEETKSLLGLATIFFQKNLVRWIAEIHDVVVTEEARGRGIGERLVELLLAIAQDTSEKRSVGKIKLYLTSRPSRVAANSLYHKLGFILVAKANGEWGTNLYKKLSFQNDKVHKEDKTACHSLYGMLFIYTRKAGEERSSSPASFAYSNLCHVLPWPLETTATQ